MSDIPTGITKKESQEEVTEVSLSKKSEDTLTGINKEIEDTIKKSNKKLIDNIEENNEKTSSLFSKLTEKSVKLISNISDNIGPSLLGPLNLITEPLKELTGIDILGSIKTGLGKIFEKKSRRNPTKAQVAKKGDAGSLLINNTLENILGDKDKDLVTNLTKILSPKDETEEEQKSKFSFLIPKRSKRKPSKSDVANKGDAGSLLIVDTLEKVFGKKKTPDMKKTDGDMGGLTNIISGGAGGIGKMLLKALPIVAIIASVVWMIIDGIKGAMKADEWGTSKAGATIGAVLGGTGKGWKNAFANMGKWALMGAGIGFLAGGPIGALIGGLIGAAIGLIFGLIGGENLAKATDAVGRFFKKVFVAIGEFFVKLWDGIKAISVVVWDFFKKWVLNPIGKFFVGAWKVLKTATGILLGYFYEWVIKPIGKLFAKAWDGIKVGTKIAWDWLMEWIFTPLGEFFTVVWKGMKKVAKKVGKFFMKWLIEPIGKFFSKVWDALKSAGATVIDFFKTYVINPIKGLFEIIWGAVKDAIYYVAQKNVFATGQEKEERGRAEDIAERNQGDLSGINRFLMDRGVTAREGLKEITIRRLLDENPELMDELESSNIKRTYNVQDAIIKSDGTLIRTSPDDNIIATKNEPLMESMFKNLGTKQPNKTNTSFNEMIFLFKELISVTKNLNMQSIIMNPDNNINMEKLIFEGLGE